MPNLGVTGDQEGTNSKGDKIIVAIESGFTQSGARRWREFQNVVQLDDDSLLLSLSLSLSPARSFACSVLLLLLLRLCQFRFRVVREFDICISFVNSF